jgi:hypothetical protein
MARRQDTQECAILMIELYRFDVGYNDSQYVYDDINREVGRVFKRQGDRPYEGGLGRRINKFEARWLPRRGPDLEGYPCTLAIDKTNACAVLKLMLQRQGSDIIEVTMGTG